MNFGRKEISNYVIRISPESVVFFILITKKCRRFVSTFFVLLFRTWTISTTITPSKY